MKTTKILKKIKEGAKWNHKIYAGTIYLDNEKVALEIPARNFLAIYDWFDFALAEIEANAILEDWTNEEIKNWKEKVLTYIDKNEKNIEAFYNTEVGFIFKI